MARPPKKLDVVFVLDATNSTESISSTVRQEAIETA
jgi:hypothetical protein